MARMTMNKPNGDIGMGDRMLAIWQGLGFYHYTTCDEPSKNPNVVKNAKVGDMEGAWTYVYYSYHTEYKKAVAFLKYRD
jgi:hypothetical protein